MNQSNILVLSVMSFAICGLGSVAGAAPKAQQSTPTPVAKKSMQFEGTGEAVEADVGDGCGLGWQVTQKRSFLATTTRGTTNAFVPPTFGMTSGTIGCAQHSFAKNEAPAVNFAVTNQEALMIEMAQGKGEYLAAFGRTLGCNDSALSAFGKMSQQRYLQIMGTDATSTDVYQNVRREIQADQYLNTACQI